MSKQEFEVSVSSHGNYKTTKTFVRFVNMDDHEFLKISHALLRFFKANKLKIITKAGTEEK